MKIENIKNDAESHDIQEKYGIYLNSIIRL